MAEFTLNSIDDLKPCPWNPREISPEAASGLKASLTTFGDLSGIVWNKRSGNLVAGHQRLAQLKAEGAKYENGAVVLGDRSFPVRVVDWDEITEKAANLAANNPSIAGVFTESVKDLLADVALEAPDLSAALRLDEIKIEIDVGEPIQLQDSIPSDNGAIDEDAMRNTQNKCPKCGFQW